MLFTPWQCIPVALLHDHVGAPPYTGKPRDPAWYRRVKIPWFRFSAFSFTAFNALRLIGVWWGLAHSGCSQHQSLMKQAIEQAVTFCSEHPFTFHRFTSLDNPQSHFRYIGLFREIKAVVCSQCMIRWRTSMHRGWPGQLCHHPWSSIPSSFPSKMGESSLYFYSITVPVWFFKLTPAWNNAEPCNDVSDTSNKGF